MIRINGGGGGSRSIPPRTTLDVLRERDRAKGTIAPPLLSQIKDLPKTAILAA